jgi:hypothetical protein
MSGEFMKLAPASVISETLQNHCMEVFSLMLMIPERLFHIVMHLRCTTMIDYRRAVNISIAKIKVSQFNASVLISGTT